MTQCNQISLGFEGRREVLVQFDAEHTTSDAGALLLSRMDHNLGLTDKLAAAITDPRSSSRVVHALKTLIQQRVFQIAQGWEDCNDADFLRHDPAFKAACGRGALGLDLASQPTLSRIENVVSEKDLLAMRQALLDSYLATQPKRRRRIILDSDVTNADTHGHQQLSFFNGYYHHTCLTPLMLFDGVGGDLLAVMLRAGNAGTGEGEVELLEWLIPQLRAKWPRAKILVRLDAGFAWPSIFNYCENQGLDYLIGMKGNSNLGKMATGTLSLAQIKGKEKEKQCQVFGCGTYQSSGWKKPRRVIWKAESGPLVTDVRFVVTNLLGTPRELYRQYCQRGESENWIKAFKNALHGDRMSCHLATANQYRLLIHAAAYQLMLALSRYLKGTVGECWQFDTLRLRLLKVGGSVKESARRIVWHLASSHPHQDLWRLLVRELVPG